MRTEYLLRFDDMTPGMDRALWERFVPLLDGYGVKPILAVVPENHDPELNAGEDDPGFWHDMRAWQHKGAVIGLHGYRHLCESRGGGLIPLHRRTEFGGASEKDQQAWIEAGMRILRRHGLEARIWVGPRHGTDRTTIRALAQVGIHTISDGFWTEPVLWHGAIWIPQQIWEPREMSSGLWTICLHAGTATDALVEQLKGFLERNAAKFTTVERVLEEWTPRRFGVGDWVVQRWWLEKRRARLALAKGESQPA